MQETMFDSVPGPSAFAVAARRCECVVEGRFEDGNLAEIEVIRLMDDQTGKAQEYGVIYTTEHAGVTYVAVVPSEVLNNCDTSDADFVLEVDVFRIEGEDYVLETDRAVLEYLASRVDLELVVTRDTAGHEVAEVLDLERKAI